MTADRSSNSQKFPSYQYNALSSESQEGDEITKKTNDRNKDANILKFEELLHTERLTFFSDAVIAISMTLLILPLMEAVQTATEHNQSMEEFVAENKERFYSLALSFFIVNQYWRSHDRLFRYVSRYSEAVRRCNGILLFSILLVPVNTASITQLSKEGSILPQAMYVANLLLIDSLLLLMNVLVRNDPRMWEETAVPLTSLGICTLLGGFIYLSLTMMVVILCRVTHRRILYMLFVLVFIDPSVRTIHRNTDIVHRVDTWIDRFLGNSINNKSLFQKKNGM